MEQYNYLTAARFSYMAGRKPKNDVAILLAVLEHERGFVNASEIADEVGMSRQGVHEALMRMESEYEFLKTSKLGESDRSPRVWEITGGTNADDIQKAVESAC